MLRFDHIVIGAGTAGCIVAERLSRDSSVAVLLIESGSALLPEGSSLDMFTYLQGEGRLDETLQARKFPGGPLQAYARGQGLGGSNAINELISVAGLPSDYDTWATEFGCSQWSWEHVEPTIRALMESTIEAPTSLYGEADRLLIDSGTKIGFPARSLDLEQSAGSELPASKVSAGTVSMGIQSARLQLAPDASSPLGFRRNPTALSALAIAISRPNLTIEAGISAREVLFDRSTPRCAGAAVTTGVRLADGREFASPSVICCAGAIQTPALLLRSRVQLPGVGVNLQDHPALAFSMRADVPPSVGQLTSATLLHTQSTSQHGAWIQVLPMNQLGLRGPAREHLGLMAAAMTNHGRGQVTIDSDGEPEVQFDLLSDPRDTEIMHDVLTLLIKLAEASGVSDDQWFVDDQGTSVRALKTLGASELTRWIPNNLANYAHAAGTCRMGIESDPMAVVDQSGAVFGYRGLRVIDASVFPTLPQANPNLSVMLLATRMT